MSKKYLLKKIIVATTIRSCKGMKVVSSRTLELRSALPQIWQERKKDSVNNATMSPGKLSTTTTTLLFYSSNTSWQGTWNVVHFDCSNVWQAVSSKFHPSRLHHAFSYMILKKLEEISGSDHSFVGFLCHPETTKQPHFEDCSRVLLQVWFFWRISWNLFTRAFFSFLFFFSFVMYLNW